MTRFILITALLASLVGCSEKQVAQLQADEQTAQQTLAATTQATADAQAVLTALPLDAPGRAAATDEISKAQKVEQDAQLAMNVAQAALNAAQKKDATDPALGSAVAAAVSAIPSPWTPVLASLIPAAIPLLVSIVQSVKLGRAHQTVQTVTKQLEEHKAALAAITNPGEGHMTDLTAEQLEAIRRLLIDPLRETVRQEIRLAYQRLASAMKLLEERLGEHERRLAVVERSTARLRAFRRKVVAIYGVIALVLGVAWEILRDKVISRLTGR